VLMLVLISLVLCLSHMSDPGLKTRPLWQGLKNSILYRKIAQKVFSSFINWDKPNLTILLLFHLTLRWKFQTGKTEISQKTCSSSWVLKYHAGNIFRRIELHFRNLFCVLGWHIYEHILFYLTFTKLM